MANEYFTPSGYPATGAAGSSASMRSELALVEDGFDKLPTLTGNGGKIVAVNSGGTGLTTSATLSESGGTVTVTGNVTVNGAVSLQGGTFTFNDAGADLDARFEGDTDANLLFLDASTDRVGVGTSTPAAKFHVFGAAKVGTGAASNSHTLMVNNPNGTGTALQLFQDSQESWAMGLPASSTALTWSNSGAERMRITSSGDVGIGTSSPAGKVDSVSNATAAYVARASTAGANQTADVLTTFNSDASLYALARYNAVQHIWRYAGTTEGMRLDASGNLGIGTNTPNAKLHLGNNLTTTNTIPFQIGYAADFYGYRLINTNNPSTTAAGTFSLQRGTTAAWVDVLTSDNNGNVAFGNSSANNRMLVYTAGVNASYLQVANGSTGVGATQGVRLGVQAGGTAELITDLALAVSTGNLERVRVTSSGDVGIGTATPGARLQVKSTAAEALRIEGTTARGSGSVYASFYDPTGRKGYWGYSTGIDDGFYVVNEMNAQMAFFTNATERMRIAATGEVGIGTASPAQILDIVKAQNSGTAAIVRNGNTGASASAQLVVNADTATGRFAAYSSGAGGLANLVTIEQTTNNPIAFYTNGSERVRITGAGNLGIGTNSPGAAVHVVAAANTIPCIFDAPTTGYSYITMRTNGSVYGYFGQGNALISGGSATAAAIRSENELLFSAGGSTERMRITSAGNISAGAGAVATTATDGFLYVPTCAGTPTGTPTAITGMAPIVVNTTNNKLYFYSGGAWRDAGP